MGKGDTTQTHNDYSAVNPALQTLRSHEAETPVTPFHAADEDSDERAQRDEGPLAAMRNKRRREDQHLRQTGGACVRQAPPNERHNGAEADDIKMVNGFSLRTDSDGQATPPLSRAGAETRTATSRPRLLSPGPALEKRSGGGSDEGALAAMRSKRRREDQHLRQTGARKRRCSRCQAWHAAS